MGKLITDKSGAINRLAEGRARAALVGGLSKMDKHNSLKQKIMLEVEKKIGKQSKWVVDKLFELAEGIYIAEELKDGEVVRYYKQKPDKEVLMYLLDRILGKPTIKTEHKEEKKGLLVIENIIRTLATPKPIINEQDGSTTRQPEPALITVAGNDNDLGVGEDTV